MGERQVQRRETLGDAIARLPGERALARPIVGDPGRREVQPLVGFDIVLANAVAALVHQAELQLRLSMPGFGSGAKPVRRLAMVLHHAGTAIGQHRDLELRLDVAVACRTPHPYGRGSEVRGGPEAVGVHQREFELSIRLVARRRSSERFDRHDEVTARVGVARGREIGISREERP